MYSKVIRKKSVKSCVQAIESNLPWVFLLNLHVILQKLPNPANLSFVALRTTQRLMMSRRPGRNAVPREKTSIASWAFAPPRGDKSQNKSTDRSASWGRRQTCICEVQIWNPCHHHRTWVETSQAVAIDFYVSSWSSDSGSSSITDTPSCPT